MKISLLATSVLVGLAMAGAAASGQALKPHLMLSEVQAFDLQALVPSTFGTWHAVPGSGNVVVDPGTQKTLDTYYSQLLNRTYVDNDGYAIMLAVAYGNDQRRSLVAHRPDVCYPAQGFSVQPSAPVNLVTPFGEIPAEHMFAVKGTRREPVTFWFTIGEHAVRNKLERRLATLRYSLTGEIADGLLFRVSSIDTDERHGYERQAAFVTELSRSLSSQGRSRLAGLP